MPKRERHCQHCKKPFSTSHKSKYYCSETCKQATDRDHAVRLETLLELGKWNRQDQLTAQRGRCFYCSQAISLDEATVDHLTPKARGGDTVPPNLAIACKECNSSKGVMTHDEYIDYRAKAKTPPQTNFKAKKVHPYDEYLRRRLRGEIGKQKRVRSELAKDINVSRATVHNILNGDTNLINEKALIILDALGLELTIQEKPAPPSQG